MAKKFKSIEDLITNLSEDESFKKNAIKHISENKLGKFLFFLRCQHKLTQKEMAEKMGCSQGRISKIESSSDDHLSVKDLIDYGNALNFELEIGFRNKKMKWADMVKYHALQMQMFLNKMVQVAKEDKAIETGVLDFHIETLKNVPRLILDSMAKLPQVRFNKLMKDSQTHVHIASPIQFAEQSEVKNSLS